MGERFRLWEKVESFFSGYKGMFGELVQAKRFDRMVKGDRDEGMGIKCDVGFEWCDSIVPSMGVDKMEKEGHNCGEFEGEVGELLNKAFTFRFLCISSAPSLFNFLSHFAHLSHFSQQRRTPFQLHLLSYT